MNRLERLENLSAYIDGELTEGEQRWLAAWCENHPEDVEEFEAIAEVVRLVRESPDVDPPAGLTGRIRSAVAQVEPVAASREQALSWLDRYFDADLPEVQRAVVEHYWATDAEFAETAEMHLAVLDALGGIEEQEPPADLRERIHASVDAAKRGQAAPAGPRPLRRVANVSPRARRFATLAVAAALLFTVGVGLGRRGGGEPAAPSGGAVAVQPAAPAAVHNEVADTRAVQPSQPAGPLAEGPVVEQDMEPDAAPVRLDREDRGVPAERRRGPLDNRTVADRDLRGPGGVIMPSLPRAGGTGRGHGDVHSGNRGPAAPKSAPRGAPAPNPADGVGRLAGESVDRSGSGSVLGDETGRSGEAEGGRTAPDPTRRSEAPPF
ncbi:MAG: hypothetical protein HYU66_19500 [Armatimonadetes bacterium]|nr:hypothetical protein [Armatimonadota bacterium]